MAVNHIRSMNNPWPGRRRVQDEPMSGLPLLADRFFAGTFETSACEPIGRNRSKPALHGRVQTKTARLDHPPRRNVGR